MTEAEDPTAPTHVLFDFFGTLVSYSASRTDQGYERSHGLLTQAGSDLGYQQFLDLLDQVAEEFEAAAVKTHREFSMIDVIGAFLGQAVEAPSERLLEDFVSSYLAEWSKGVCYLDGVPQLLERLADRFSLAVITNTHDPDFVPNHLEEMGVARFFSHVVTSVEHGRRKPDPSIFQYALEQVQASPIQCVYVGDNYEADYQGARRAGIRPLLIDPELKSPIPGATRLGSIFELEARLLEMAAD